MNHGYYVASHQISYHIQQQGCLNRNPDNIADQYKFRLSSDQNYLNLKNMQINHCITTKNTLLSNTNSKVRKTFHQPNYILLEDKNLKMMNKPNKQSIKLVDMVLLLFIYSQQSKQSKCMNGYLVKQQLSSNSYQSPKQQQITDYHTVNKDKTVILQNFIILLPSLNYQNNQIHNFIFINYIKTEPDTQLCSERIICKKTPIIIPKYIQSKEQIKSIFNQIYPQHKPADEITNLKLDIKKENQSKHSKLKTDVQEKLLDLLMLSTRELKIKLSDKRTKQTSIPKTTKAGLPVDFFNFKK